MFNIVARCTGVGSKNSAELCFPGAVTSKTEVECPHCGELVPGAVGLNCLRLNGTQVTSAVWPKCKIHHYPLTISSTASSRSRIDRPTPPTAPAAARHRQRMRCFLRYFSLVVFTRVLFALTSLPNHNTKFLVRHHRAAGQGKWGDWSSRSWIFRNRFCGSWKEEKYYFLGIIT